MYDVNEFKFRVLHNFKDSWLNPDIYSVDHRYHVSQQPEKLIILYGQVGTPKFSDFHNKLKTLAKTNGINYILRHYLKVL